MERRSATFALTLLLILAALTPVVLSRAGTEADAQEAIERAEQSIRKAQDMIDKAKQHGAETHRAEGKLRSAEGQLKVAMSAYEKGRFDQAIDHAEKAKAAADQARTLAQEALNKKTQATTATSTSETKSKTSKSKTSKSKTSKTFPTTEVKTVTSTDRSKSSVSRTTTHVISTHTSLQTMTTATTTNGESIGSIEINEASMAQRRAEEALNETKNLSIIVDVSEIQAVLGEANAYLSIAKDALESGRYDEAKSYASMAKTLFGQAAAQAESLVENAQDLLEELQRIETAGVGTPPQAMNVSIVEGKDASVDTSTHSVNISLTVPSIVYSTDELEAKVDFKSKAYALVEFFDRNEDGKIQEGEILQELPLVSLDWSVLSEVQESGTTVTLIYFYNTTSYELSITMNLLRSPTIQYFPVDNDETVAYLVDGNANEVKFDFSVMRWPWSSSFSNLALRLLIEPQSAGSMELRSLGKNEEWLTFDTDNKTIRIKWITKARVRLPNGNERIVDVQASHDRSDAVEILVDFIYPNFQGRALIHDPSVGIGGPLTRQSILQAIWVCIGSGVIVTVVLTATKASERNRRRSAIYGNFVEV